MRRKDKEITERELIDSVISQSQVCHIGLCDEGRAYIIPMCFGYDGQHIYLHCAREGRKIDILKQNPAVCFTFETDCEVKKADKGCSFTMRYRSVMGTGKASFVDDTEAKRRALEIIMKQYDEGQYSYTDEALDKILIIVIDITEMTGKKSGY
jgi:uncharacterized protein